MTPSFASRKIITDLPRLPLKGSLDLTYRCNNRCRHCWLRTTDGRGELSTQEIFALVDAARAMGCREWAISGGEPMLRPDFPAVFEYITSRAKQYSINTNGTLITPEIAGLMRRKGSKMVALYGATAAVHDHVTQNPGSFAATMRGFELLKEAGAGFTVQIIPMKDNWHEYPAMLDLAQSLSPLYRIGAPWLYLSAGLDPVRNAEIDAQRLSPRDVVELDRPDYANTGADEESGHPQCPEGDDRLFAACIAVRRDFHVDPYGMMTFCSFIKDPAMRYDLRKGTFHDAWERFIPSLADRIRGGDEYRATCGSCDYRSDCRWCPVYGYLEHGRHSAKVEHLCDVARESRACRERLLRENRRCFRTGAITFQVDSDLPFSENTFDGKFGSFRADGPGEDTVSIRHLIDLPDLPEENRGSEVCQNGHVTLYRKGRSWIYTGTSADGTAGPLHHVAIFSDDHTSGRIYHDTPFEAAFRKGNLGSLLLFPPDEILTSLLLADRDGVLLQSAAVSIGGRVMLFAGLPDAGRSASIEKLAGAGGKTAVDIISNSQTIVRHHAGGWNIYRTWSDTRNAAIPPGPAPLHAILFPEPSGMNRIIRIGDPQEIVHRLETCLVRPYVTDGWEEKTLACLGRLAVDVPCCVMKTDMSGAALDKLRCL